MFRLEERVKRGKRRRGDVVQTIARAADLLYWFADNSGPVKFSEICRRFRLSKAVTHRLLTTLEYKGLIVREASTRAYSLGGGIAKLATHLLYAGDLVSVSRETMHRLQASLAESITLSIRIDFQRFCIYQLESPLSLRFTLPLGKPQPLYCGATGKLLLAMMDDAEIRRYFEAVPLVPLTPTTPTDRTRLLGEIEEVRGAGYATSVEEADAGGAGVASPIMGVGSRCLGALGVLGPTARMLSRGLGEIGKELTPEARRISSRLGAAEKPTTVET